MIVLQKIGKIVLVNIYLVILAGSVVRMTGSGMGCPDWPMCFGLAIPPTSEEEIKWKPNHVYNKGDMIIHALSGNKDALIEANEDFKSGDYFEQIHWNKYEKHDYAKFNVYHTWTEYINRLMGALLGFFALIMLFISIKQWKHDKWLTFLAVLQLFFIGFEAWLGKVTVDYNLEAKTITYHMLGAMVLIVLQLIYLRRIRIKNTKISISNYLFYVLLALLILLLTQIVLGTQVRQEVDVLLQNNYTRESVVGNFSIIPYIHRSFSVLLVLTLSFISWKLWTKTALRKMIVWLNATMWFGILIGIYLFYFSMPAVAQPFHLLFSLVLFGLLVNMVIGLKHNR